MKISRVEVFKLEIPYIRPMRIAIGAISCAQNVAVKLSTDSGLCGWGESSPFAPITGDSFEGNLASAEKMALAIKDCDALATEVLHARLKTVNQGESSLRSAFDMALFDIAAKQARLPLYRFLGGEARDLRTDITIGIQPGVDDTVDLALEAKAAGFDAIKLKVGRSGLTDAHHVKAVRLAVGTGMAIKIDSNQGWDLPTAVKNLNAMADLDLQYAEQPLAAWDYEGMHQLRSRVSIPICADECVFDETDALKLVRAGASDYMNIKLGKCGGLSAALRINSIAEAAGQKCMIGCFAESRLGLGVACHLAAARPNIQFIDLDSAFMFKTDPVLGGIIFCDQEKGVLRLPDRPGHGASYDEAFLDKYIEIQL